MKYYRSCYLLGPFRNCRRYSGTITDIKDNVTFISGLIGRRFLEGRSPICFSAKRPIFTKFTSIQHIRLNALIMGFITNPYNPLINYRFWLIRMAIRKKGMKKKRKKMFYLLLIMCSIFPYSIYEWFICVMKTDFISHKIDSKMFIYYIFRIFEKYIYLITKWQQDKRRNKLMMNFWLTIFADIKYFYSVKFH